MFIWFSVLFQCIKDSEAEVVEKGSKVLFGGSHGEFQVRCCRCVCCSHVLQSLYSHSVCVLQVTVWGARHQEETYEGEVFLWQLEGESEVTRGDGSTTVLQEDSCIIIPAMEK